MQLCKQRIAHELTSIGRIRLGSEIGSSGPMTEEHHSQKVKGRAKCISIHRQPVRSKGLVQKNISSLSVYIQRRATGRQTKQREIIAQQV
jgi:hypothetical protein